MNAVELEIELFCRGMRIDRATASEDHRPILRTRAGLGSGLELVIPRRPKDVWVNVPVVEAFAARSPFLLVRGPDGDYAVRDERDGAEYSVVLPPEPAWYSSTTTSGTEMCRIGVLQGNYLGIYVSNQCMYWNLSPAAACRFCTTGKNVGTTEKMRKSVEDVVEVATAARDQSNSVFTHLNTGYHFEDVDAREPIHGLRQCAPYVRALRQRVGGFIGVQAIPMPPRRMHVYDELIDDGVDHFSFCYEFEDEDYFELYCPGKAHTIGQCAFFHAMEYTAKKLGKGRVSGEIIAGVEPVRATKRAIDRIVDAGAFPTVCIFRPTIGSGMEDYPPPEPAAMFEVFAHLHEACRRARMPIGILPIEVSLVVQPEETEDLVESNLASTLYRLQNRVLRHLARPYVRWKTRAPHAHPAA